MVAGVSKVASRLIYLALSPDLNTVQCIVKQSRYHLNNDGGLRTSGCSAEIIRACTALKELVIQDIGLTLDTLRRLPALDTLHITLIPYMHEFTTIRHALETGEIAQTITRLSLLWHTEKENEKVNFSMTMAKRGIKVNYVSDTCDALAHIVTRHFYLQLPRMMQAPDV